MKDTRTISQTLFGRKRPVDGFPYLRGRQEISYPARRNKGKGHLSAMLCKAVVVALKENVLTISTLKPPGKVALCVKSQSGRGVNTVIWVGDQMWLPFGVVTYHLGLLALAEALVRKNEAIDLLDGWQEVLEYRESEDVPESDPNFVELVAHVSDELWYWSAYEDRELGWNRLDSLEILNNNSPPSDLVLGWEIDHQVLTQSEALKEYRFGAEEEEVAPAVVTTGKCLFRGWQLPELVDDLKLGFHCLLVGPTATGKSLSAFEAFELADLERAIFVIEGHESMKEFDLLGCYVPDEEGKYVWHDGVLIQAMRAGGFLFIDEANRMPTRTLNVLLGVLSRGAVVLTEHGSEEVKAQQGFQVVMAMNLGRGYSVNALDAALLDRFQVTLEYRYLPSADEEDLLMELTGIDRVTAEVMVKVAAETRAKRRNKELSGEITPRDLIAWAEKVKGKGEALAKTLKQAAKVTWMHSVAGVDSDGYLRDDVTSELLVLIESHSPKGGGR